MKFKTGKRMRRLNLRTYILIIIAIVAILLVSGVVMIRKVYTDNLKPVSTAQKSHVITVEPGMTTAAVADTLYSKGAIKSDWAFEWYVRNHQLRDQLKAGTYLVDETQSVEQIVNMLVEGKIRSDLVTILPGKRLAQVRDSLVQSGFSVQEVDAALEPSQYAGHPALTDKPTDASLEGYLYPESFQKTGQTTAKEVIELSLDEMQVRLTPDVRQALSQQGLTVHQGVTLASIVEQEVSNQADRAQAAQVFIKRYKTGMSLGSDPTASYGAILDGQEPSVNYDSVYNTRIRTGLPPGPIGNASESSLKAVAYPAQTDWLYFVSGDDKKTYFSKTLEEHEELTRKHCIDLCDY
jgi:UPF0755 protein